MTSTGGLNQNVLSGSGPTSPRVHWAERVDSSRLLSSSPLRHSTNAIEQENERGQSMSNTRSRDNTIVQSINDSMEVKFDVVRDQEDVPNLESTSLRRNESVDLRSDQDGSVRSLRGSPIRAAVISIQRKFDSMSPLSPGYSISRVPERLRNVNEDAYMPMLVSIGPFHHGEEKLQPMEYDKVRYLFHLLDRCKKHLRDFVVMLMEIERSARKYYASNFHYSRKEFVEMMLLDGCFIIELIWKYKHADLRDEHDPIFKNHWIFDAIHHDLLLLENQLPFFVLHSLFTLIYSNGQDEETLSNSFIVATHKFLGHYRTIPKMNEHIGEHLVHLVLKNFTSSEKSNTNRPRDTQELAFIPSATELHQVGIKFKRALHTELLDVRFEEAALQIPTLVVDHRTESLFRNLIALEQTHSDKTIMNNDEDIHNTNDSTTKLSDYVTLLDCLINTSADVAFLRDQGIIQNRLGDNKEVAQLFNNLRSGIVTLSNEFHYFDIFDDVNVYYGAKWNKLKAKLKRDYFNSPWAKISFCAAAFLLICAALQTVCAVLQVLQGFKIL